MSLSGRKLLLKIMALLFVSAFCFAQEVKIKSVKPLLQNNRFMVASVFENLLSKDLTDGLASGMARTLNFRFDLVQKNSQKVYEFYRTVKLRYDVWEGIYFLSNRKQKKQFDQFEELNHFLNDSLNFDLLPFKKLPVENSIQIILYFSPENISETQKRKLEFWMDEENENQTSTPGDNESGFSINLSGLISLFTSKENPKNTATGKSGHFTIKSLKENENP
ncbi:MAG: DUF4390 domain-containing protein [Calditrichaeota bacterium]|nr:MAG: DUF4390 domain-containing protein [Calditrichota bacterium]MBL1206118.1 DUF4390 domain-containing protein [Calditrichota bacterium]NOG45943.1 hypothetical protein [Calditrichota bacterium]